MQEIICEAHYQGPGKDNPKPSSHISQEADDGSHERLVPRGVADAGEDTRLRRRRGVEHQQRGPASGIVQLLQHTGIQ